MAPSFCYVNYTTQRPVICKITEGVLDVIIYVTDEDIEEIRSQDLALRDTHHPWPPPGHGATEHNSLAVSTQPIPSSLNGPPFKPLVSHLETRMSCETL
ncbi:hypothetical protein BTVI_33916 [Pitangus sulphuratus]|nr:hypothetical protein BTVI_33916 [Pitangus sulphuratus]